jgi:bis(5'-nucleosyl)-tetraphosphatase (symmetrical)
MTLYAVGDLQGCLHPLEQLLEHVRFDPSKDELWLTGDLVNRGPDSIGCLRFVRSLGSAAKTVLGNHDLHLIAIHELKLKPRDSDIQNTLSHPDAPELLKWLRKQPLLIRDKQRKLIMTHAGIPPVWSDRKARLLADEFDAFFASKKHRTAFLSSMYGNEPDTWQDKLLGNDRLRYIVNAYTRMRFCTKSATLDFQFKSSPKTAPAGMKPWYLWPVKRKHRIVFGHWAALMGHTGRNDTIGLDTGYVWGNHLTLMDMDNNIRYTCDTEGQITQFTELEFECLSEPAFSSTKP